MSKSALVPIADGTEELEAVAVIDLLRRAGIDVTVASVSSSQTVGCSRGVKITADTVIDHCRSRTFDAIVLPGGMPGAEHLRDNAILTELLKAQHQAGRLIAAICASPIVVLKSHGLLAKKSTCYPSLADQLHDPKNAALRVAADGHCITSAGPGTAVEFAIEIIRHLLGKDQAKQVAEQILAKTA